MKKIVRKDGKIYEVWSNDATFRHTTWSVIGTYEEEAPKEEEKPKRKRKNNKN